MLSEEIINNIKKLSNENLLKSYNTLIELNNDNEIITLRINALSEELEQRRK